MPNAAISPSEVCISEQLNHLLRCLNDTLHVLDPRLAADVPTRIHT
jgi:hypothetical protein